MKPDFIFSMRAFASVFLMAVLALALLLIAVAFIYSVVYWISLTIGISIGAVVAVIIIGAATIALLMTVAARGRWGL